MTPAWSSTATTSVNSNATWSWTVSSGPTSLRMEPVAWTPLMSIAARLGTAMELLVFKDKDSVLLSFTKLRQFYKIAIGFEPLTNIWLQYLFIILLLLCVQQKAPAFCSKEGTSAPQFAILISIFLLWLSIGNAIIVGFTCYRNLPKTEYWHNILMHLE